VPSFLYLTAPGIRHSFGANSATLTTIELKFIFPDPRLQEKASRLPPVVEDATGELKQLLERIIGETEYPRPYQQELMETRLRELIFFLLRIVQGDACETALPETVMQPVLHYCRQNLYKNITLENLAETAKFEKTYFS